MTVIDYNKKTGQFKLCISKKLSRQHRDFLRTLHKDGEINFCKVMHFDDTKTFMHKYETFHDLQDWGLIKKYYNYDVKDEVVVISDLGKIVMNLQKGNYDKR